MRSQKINTTASTCTVSTEKDVQSADFCFYSHFPPTCTHKCPLRKAAVKYINTAAHTYQSSAKDGDAVLSIVVGFVVAGLPSQEHRSEIRVCVCGCGYGCGCGCGCTCVDPFAPFRPQFGHRLQTPAGTLCKSPVEEMDLTCEHIETHNQMKWIHQIHQKSFYTEYDIKPLQ